MISNDQFRKRLAELFRSQSLATLATHNDGQPYASLVAFYAADDLKHIYFVTPKTTRKFECSPSRKKVIYFSLTENFYSVPLSIILYESPVNNVQHKLYRISQIRAQTHKYHTVVQFFLLCMGNHTVC